MTAYISPQKAFAKPREFSVAQGNATSGPLVHCIHTGVDISEKVAEVKFKKWDLRDDFSGVELLDWLPR